MKLKILNNISVRSIFCFLIILFLQGCEKYKFASIDANISDDIPSDLKKRYLNYWESKSKNDYKVTFTLELPYENYLKPLEEYISFQTATKTKYKIKALNIKKPFIDTFIITSEIDFGYKKTLQNDKWIEVNGIWYHYYYPNILPPL